MDIDSSLKARIEQILPELDGWCTLEKALSMAACVCRHRPACCVEIGVHGGRSLLPMALACQHVGVGRVYGIDPWSPECALDGLREPENIEFWSNVDYERFHRDCLEAILRHKLTEFCTLLRMPSERCGGLFDQIDLLHIDGNHSPAAAVRDIELYLPKVPVGGNVWFDDADWDSTHDAVRMLHRSCDVVEDAGGWIWFRRRDSAPLSLTSSSDDSPSINRRDADNGNGDGRAEYPVDSNACVERKILIDSTGDDWQEYPGGLYNPGGAVFDGRVVLLARNERFTELQRQHDPESWKSSCRPVVIEIDARGRVEQCRPLELDGAFDDVRAEDFRLFVDGDQLLTSYSHVLTPESILNSVSAVDLAKGRVGPPRQPLVDFPLRRIEKNWCYFEHAGELHAMYSMRPYRLLRLADREEFRFETFVHGATDVADSGHPWRLAEQISLSTCPVAYDDDHLLTFVHWRGENLNYQQYGMLISRESLRPVRIASFPLFKGGDAAGVHPHVVYLMSIVRRHDSFAMYLGEGDQHISSAHLSDAAMHRYMDDSVPIEFRDVPHQSIVGEYLYEHRGHFTRCIRLGADGGVSPCGDHDTQWTMRQDGRDLELVLLGMGKVSCRLRQKSANVWSGRWNWGARPTARLTRLHPDAPRKVSTERSGLG